MARSIGKLTALFVARVTKPGNHGDRGGLYLQVGEGAAKSWIYRYGKARKEHHVGLGPVHTVTLADARAPEKVVELRSTGLVGPDHLAVEDSVLHVERTRRLAGERVEAAEPIAVA